MFFVDSAAVAIKELFMDLQRIFAKLMP